MLSQRLQKEMEDLAPVFQPSSKHFMDQTSILQIGTVPQHSEMSLPNYSTITQPNHSTLFQPSYSTIHQPNHRTILQPPYSTIPQPHHSTIFQPPYSTIPQSQHNIPQTEQVYIPQDSSVFAKTEEDEMLYPTVIYDKTHSQIKWHMSLHNLKKIQIHIFGALLYHIHREMSFQDTKLT